MTSDKEGSNSGVIGEVNVTLIGYVKVVDKWLYDPELETITSIVDSSLPVEMSPVESNALVEANVGVSNSDTMYVSLTVESTEIPYA